MKTTLSVLAVFLFSWTVAPNSRAAVMVSNLNEANFGFFSIGDLWAGNRFITDASASVFQLQNVILSMAAASADNGGFFVAIYSNGVGAPGTLLETLSGTANPAAAGQYTFTSSGLSLSPGTSYWVVAGTTGGGGTYKWNVAGEVVAYTGPWQIPTTDTHITSFSEGGDHWNSFPNDGYARQFSVSAVAVPEPATALLLLGAGLPVLFFGFNQRRKSGARPLFIKA